MEDNVRWTVKVSKETDISVRTFLAQRGMKKGDLSRFIEDAVRRSVQDQAAREAGATSAPYSRSAQAAAEAQLPPLITAHRAPLIALCKRYAVVHLGVFGSALRADFNPTTSDVDLVIEFAAASGQSPARQYFDFKRELEALLKRPVDLVEIKSMAPTRLRRIIERTQVPLNLEAA